MVRGNRVASEQSPQDGSRRSKSRVALVLRGPARSHNALVQRFATTKRDPWQTAGKHLRQRCHEMRKHCRMIAPTSGDREAAKRECRPAQGRAEPCPVVARVPLAFAPRRNIIRCHGCVEACLFRGLYKRKQLTRRKLFVGSMVTDDHCAAPRYSVITGITGRGQGTPGISLLTANT